MEMVTLSAADIAAIERDDAAYINNKGERFYDDESFYNAIEYYRIGAAMGNTDSIINLGYCYLYGKSAPENLDIAVSYFKIAAKKGSIDASSKLGEIYGSDDFGVYDRELSLYYFTAAAGLIMNNGWEGSGAIAWTGKLDDYPELCYALGKEMSEGGIMKTDLDVAYQFLKHAKIGYETAISRGEPMLEPKYKKVLNLVDDAQFDMIRIKYDDLFEEVYSANRNNSLFTLLKRI